MSPDILQDYLDVCFWPIVGLLFWLYVLNPFPKVVVIKTKKAGE